MTEIFLLSDPLSQAIFFNSSLPLMVEQFFCSKTDAIGFWVGITAITFSIVTMVTWKKQCSSYSAVPIPLSTRTAFTTMAGLHCLRAPSSISY